MSSKETALQIINFLKSSVSNKEVSEDYLESIDVAIDCIADAYEVDKDQDQKTVDSEYNGKSLKEILAEFKKGQSSDSAAKKVPVHVETDDETLKKAEELKLEGNKAMARKDFAEAIKKYTDAIELTPKNAVYLSNRAAAHSSTRDHESAIADAEAAIKVDPNYSKAYSRLGLANYALNRPKEAFEAYKKGLEKEGDKPSEAMKKGYETAKKRVEEQLDLSTTEESTRDTNSGSGASGAAPGGFPDLSSLLGGGAGGAPNFAEMMNNPQLMQYAQQMMQNPGALEGLMSNPAIRQMASQFGLGGGAGAGAGAESGSGERDAGAGGAPDLSSLLNNPALRDLANNFMGGQNRNNGGN
ncbi:Small glutamine-rich tetratricopeptide repeat-containing protein beta [Wickerhamomyces ciferrii]|uniref:Small glutamine-rich tetratricopeptide repeat-containing protein beta n=1 Tax=Wickerhamomyces ciferrii (strain ATCC 14091 / BCRC 22168 / CBS 111 / JCM 3599 / NBRC 0793 / NRRL Y-1031 F-60-10) TaxID=1206466 RepID=K0KEG6_WICCF|nr:Small glutamine-rich tetratricopeptide repeat-containing protein beta [Wickerhamomyces ciferrii]CCH43530.1 Small glutamine-rich tetratricopeptide repeat-containing protein beta [Wickerhamomyces ciferrii]